MVKCAIATNRWKDRRTDLKDGHVSIHHNVENFCVARFLHADMIR